ncbi:MAG: hypothetical protein WA063_01460 [Minisyncoccia bacterium]
MKREEQKRQLESLKNYIGNYSYSAEQIINWVSNCVAFFSSIEVNESIISGFMRTFEEKEKKSGDLMNVSTFIGPFQSLSSGGLYTIRNGNDYWRSGNIHAEMVYINIAFQAAENILNNLEESERLIPKSLINFFKDKPEYSQISSSLELMEQNFENKDAVGLSEKAIALLGSILNLESTLAGKDLSKQMRQIQSTQVLKDKFGVRKEVITALDNSRILRNYLSSHKNIPIEYNVPFAVSLGIAYLVIMFLQITMATGILIK